MVDGVASFHSTSSAPSYSRCPVISTLRLALCPNYLENKVSRYLVSQVVATAQAVYARCQVWPRGMDIALLSECLPVIGKGPGKMTAAIRPAVIGEVRLGPRVHVAAMAAIVRDLLTGGRDQQRDDRWLSERMRAASLDRQECAALEALRVRLYAGGTTELGIDPTRLWY